MESFRLVFEPSSLKRSRSGSITAQVFVKIGDFLFPGAGWSDFVVVILGWWLEALRQMSADGTPGDGHFRFMDGPYSFQARSLDEERTEVVCLEERVRELERKRSIVKTTELKDELFRVGTEIVALCDELGWASRDVDALRGEIMVE
jgi:hypothetical protein